MTNEHKHKRTDVRNSSKTAIAQQSLFHDDKQTIMKFNVEENQHIGR